MTKHGPVSELWNKYQRGYTPDTSWIPEQWTTGLQYSLMIDYCVCFSWSFGVLLWEIATFGGTPYHGMDTHQFCGLLRQGYRLCRPRHSDMAL